jgi:ABC-type transporter Mla MlaB component
MLDRFKRKDKSVAKADAPGAGGAAPGLAPADPWATGAGAWRRLATYDRLGQTLVATLTVGALSGHDAADLVADVCTRLRGDTPEGKADTGGGPVGAARHVVLDLQNVQYMDSTCVGTLVELLGKLRENGGRIALVNAAHNVEYLFTLTRLDRVFPLCRDVMKAIGVVERAG